MKIYKRRFRTLFKSSVFWLLTATGNMIILCGSFALYYFEAMSAPIKFEFIDCLLWSTSLTTTIGYHTFAPQTFGGKMTVILLMLFGTVFVWSYMAFLVSALIAPELTAIEEEVQKVEIDINKLKSNK